MEYERRTQVVDLNADMCKIAFHLDAYYENNFQ